MAVALGYTANRDQYRLMSADTSGGHQRDKDIPERIEISRGCQIVFKYIIDIHRYLDID